MTGWNLSQTYRFDGQSVRYDVRGDGPAMVLVHGTPWSSYNWRNIIPALARHWRVHFYDLLGYGQSEKRDGQDVSLGVQNRLLAALLDHWGLDTPDIVGHDFGGTTVLRTHLVEGRDFRKIALIDAVSLAPWGSPFVTHVRRYEEAFRGIPAYIHKAMVAAYVRGAIHRDIDDAALAPIIEPWLDEAGQGAFYRQIAQMDQRYTDEIEQRYGDITRPVLILWGERDDWLPLATGRRLHEAIPDSQFKALPDAGHLAQEDVPELIAASLVEFFSSDA